MKMLPAAMTLLSYFTLSMTQPTVLPMTATPSASEIVAQVRNMSMAQAVAMWTRVDPDNEGIFSEQTMAKLFEEYDSNNDSHVSQEEFTQRFGANEPELNSLGVALFALIDMNHDGVINTPDIRAFYATIDTNTDGHVDRQEFVTYFADLIMAMFIAQLQQMQSTTPTSVTGPVG
ncbi:hypothetical protein ScPMuIL_010414 [Solemya velum]